MADSAATIGQTVGHYRVLEKLGAGGMGVVYKALDLKLERTVALKFLPADAARNATEKDSLLHEARAASSLDHPNIGAIYGIEQADDGQLYMVMAYYEGRTLARVISDGIPVENGLDIMVQVARGLAAAHARNIVHRDIKPGNVIVTTDGTVKIVDFGLARVITNSAATQSLHISGTLPYMSPEQVLGEAVSAACDVWALGAMLVQSLTGTSPFLRENTGATTFAILNQPPSKLEDLPPAVCAVAYHALAKKVEHRYPTAKEFLADLIAARDEVIAAASPISPDDPTRLVPRSTRQLKRYAEHASAPRWGTTQATSSRRSLYIFAIVLLFVAVLFLVPAVRRRVTSTFAAPVENHIAVLPFDSIGDDPAGQEIAAGLMDSLTGELSNINAGQQTLWVVPASIVRSRKVTDPVTAGKDLGVNLVVKGSIQRTGKDVRLSVDLIDVRNLREIGSVPLEDRTGDIGALQNEAISRLAALMKIKISADALHATGGRASPAAYDLYLQALGLMQRYDKAGNLDQAIARLNDAVKLDPQFALGFASLGEAYRLKNLIDPNDKWINQGLANLQHAIEIDDHLPSLFVSLGRFHASLGKNELALQEFQRALALDPRDSDAIMGIASAYEHMGRLQDAENNFKRGVALRPDYWDSYNTLGYFYHRQHRYDEAIAQFKRAIELTPDNAAAYSNLAAMYLELGDPASQKNAEAALQRSLALAPSYNAYANLGSMYLDQHRWADSVSMTRKALALNDQQWAVWANLVIACDWLNDREGARQARLKLLPLLKADVERNPQDASRHSQLAIYYADAKNDADAQRQLSTALALAPKDTRVLADAVETYEELGDRQRALEYVKKCFANGCTLDDFSLRSNLQALIADPKFPKSTNRP
ncbi:MAG TPA: protein kinase [Candidatus Koribacter sp.]|jgi:serine/threonine-protein kinase